MSQGGPSLTALLGLLAVAGYQNRDKIAEWLGHAGGGGQAAAPAPGGAAPSQPGGLGGLLDGLRGQDPGSFLGGALGGLVDQFKGAGHGDVADSWVKSGPNAPISGPDLEHAIGPDTLDALARQTGLSREDILSRLSRNLPEAVDRYTPDGAIPGRA